MTFEKNQTADDTAEKLPSIVSARVMYPNLVLRMKLIVAKD